MDTNVVVSGLLWAGPPNRLLKWARDGILEIFGCPKTTDEVRRVLHYEKFHRRLSDLDVSSDEAYAYFVNLISFVPTPQDIPQIIHNDPFDNYFLALAAGNKVHLVVSGDKHLLELTSYKNIQIVTPSEAAATVIKLMK
jgi:putative PIN family toxin of toxin-antitoxin system